LKVYGRDTENLGFGQKQLPERILAGSQAPAWEPLSCKLLLDLSSESWNFKKTVPKRELGNEQKLLKYRMV